MAYIGRDTDKLSNIEVLDAITFDGSSSYTLQKNSVNFTPSSANNVLVSIDGVVQANNFTVSGSTIDFGVAVPSTSTCDWIYHIGVGLITTPADGTVTTAKLADASVTAAKLSGVTQGITQANEWRITANITSDGDITANWEKADNARNGSIGTGMTESSGVFSFPETGIYRIDMVIEINALSSNYLDNVVYDLDITNDGGSTYSTVTFTSVSMDGNWSAGSAFGYNSSILDITDISQQKIKFTLASVGQTVRGDTNATRTGFFMTRLGDT